MISFDAIIIEFVSKNLVFLYIVLMVFKIIAKRTKWAADDEIVSMLLGMIRSIRKPAPKEQIGLSASLPERYEYGPKISLTAQNDSDNVKYEVEK